jgi:hypothetical protein
MAAPSFDDIKFDGDKLYKTHGTASTGTIKGAGIAKGHILFILKTKKKIWFGKTTTEPDAGGRLNFEVYPLSYTEIKPFADETVTVTVVNPILPPESTGPHDAVPEPTVP